MDFRISAEQELVQKMVKDFAQREVAPTIKEWDRKQEMKPEILPRMAELGILGVCIPVRYGGQGMDYLTLGLVCEELEAVDTTLRVIMSLHTGLCSLGIFQWGSEDQKQNFLTPLASGAKYGAFGLTEPGVGSDVANLTASAKLDGDEYILNGEKTWISLATKAHTVLWFARTSESAKHPHAGICAFILDIDRDGVTTGDLHGKLGVRAGSTGWINCQDVRIPVGNRLGEEGEGFKIAMSCLDNGRYTVASGATGLIRACLDASVAYAKVRQAFGKAIASFQLVQQKIARMAKDYEASRLLYMQSGWLKNQGIRNTRETSIAKWFATDASFEHASEAIQVHGAYGFSDEYDVERYMRNARGAMIYEGSSEIQTLIQAGYALGLREDASLRRELPAYDAEYWLAEK